jgi:hypothetical protein
MHPSIGSLHSLSHRIYTTCMVNGEPSKAWDSRQILSFPVEFAEPLFERDDLRSALDSKPPRSLQCRHTGRLRTLSFPSEPRLFNRKRTSSNYSATWKPQLQFYKSRHNYVLRVFC